MLIVEDEALIALLARRILADAGYEVVGVATSEERALGLAARLSPDLALVDVRLQPGDGVRVARRLRDRGCVVVFATAYSNSLAESGEAGMAALCVVKPYDPAVLPEVFDIAVALDSGVPVTRRLPRGVIQLS
jgi:CheY-like chemotaxis protein